jgi:prepilin-type N-terminal cleavage/methylation domain-containing protein
MHPAGFTVVELMIAVAIIGVVASAAVSNGIVQWRREQANAAAMEFTDWLEPISRRPERTGVTCTVTVTPGTSLAPGSVYATVLPANCSTEPSLRLPAINQTSTYAVAATATSWSFTPRGAITTGTGATASSSNTNITLRFAVGGQLPLRCVRLSGTLGLFRFGSNNTTGVTTTDCTDWNRS